MEKNEQSFREMWDTIKHNNIRETEVQEGEKRKVYWKYDPKFPQILEKH